MNNPAETLVVTTPHNAELTIVRYADTDIKGLVAIATGCSMVMASINDITLHFRLSDDPDSQHSITMEVKGSDITYHLSKDNLMQISHFLRLPIEEQ